VRLTRARKSTLGTNPKPPQPPTEVLLADDEEYITLAQALKAAGIIGTGGEAKHFLTENAVLVNGEPEQRRGRKLREGDLLQAAGARVRITRGPVSE